MNKHHVLRNVQLGDTGYTLKTALDGIVDGRSRVSYEFKSHDGITLFSGNDYLPGIGVVMDSDDWLLDLMGFLLLGEGDVDDEYFDNYSPEALAFRDSQDREYLYDLYDFGSENADPEGAP